MCDIVSLCMSYEYYSTSESSPNETTANLPQAKRQLDPLRDTAEMPVIPPEVEAAPEPAYRDFGLRSHSMVDPQDQYRPLTPDEQRQAWRRARTPLFLIAGIGTVCVGFLGVGIAIDNGKHLPFSDESPAAVGPLVPTASESPSPSVSLSPSPSHSQTRKPSKSPSPSPSTSASSSPTPEQSPSPSPMLSPSYSPTFSQSPSPSPSLDTSPTPTLPTSSYVCYPTSGQFNAYCNNAPAYSSPVIASNPAIMIQGSIEFPARCQPEVGAGGMSFYAITYRGKAEYIPEDDVDPRICAPSTATSTVNR